MSAQTRVVVFGPERGVGLGLCEVWSLEGSSVSYKQSGDGITEVCEGRKQPRVYLVYRIHMFHQSQVCCEDIPFTCGSVVERGFFAASLDASDTKSIFAFQTGFYNCETTKSKYYSAEDLGGC